MIYKDFEAHAAPSDALVTYICMHVILILKLLVEMCTTANIYSPVIIYCPPGYTPNKFYIGKTVYIL